MVRPGIEPETFQSQIEISSAGPSSHNISYLLFIYINIFTEIAMKGYLQTHTQINRNILYL